MEINTLITRRQAGIKCNGFKEFFMPYRSFKLPPESYDFVLSRVESGRYESAGELMRAALRALHREERNSAEERRGAALQERMCFADCGKHWPNPHSFVGRSGPCPYRWESYTRISWHTNEYSAANLPQRSSNVVQLAGADLDGSTNRRNRRDLVALPSIE